MNTKTRKITITAIMAALTLLLGLTPIGYIPIPPIVMTLMCIPVIIGTLMEGLKTGLVLGFVFGLTSFFKTIGFTLVPDGFGMWFLNGYPLEAVLTIFIPRLLIPVVVWLVSRALPAQNGAGVKGKVNMGVSAFAGSITNTVLFLGFLYLLMLPHAAELAPMLGATPEGLFSAVALIGAINGLPEAAAAVVLAIPIVTALKKIKTKNEPGS